MTRAQMLRGVNQLADAVQTTLGPRTQCHDRADVRRAQDPKDGVTVAKSIEFKDKYENMGAQLVREVASKTNDKAGDGTTTATVLARALYSEGVKSVAAGMNPMELRKGMVKAVDRVVDILKTEANYDQGGDHPSRDDLRQQRLDDRPADRGRHGRSRQHGDHHCARRQDHG